MQLPRDVVDRLLTEPQALSDRIANLPNETLHIKMLESGSHLQGMEKTISAWREHTRRGQVTYDSMSEQRCVRERKHQTRGDEA